MRFSPSTFWTRSCNAATLASARLLLGFVPRRVHDEARWLLNLNRAGELPRLVARRLRPRVELLHRDVLPLRPALAALKAKFGHGAMIAVVHLAELGLAVEEVLGR